MPLDDGRPVGCIERTEYEWSMIDFLGEGSENNIQQESPVVPFGPQA